MKNKSNKIEKAAEVLRKMSISAGGSEKLQLRFEENDHYKVRYRFLCNMLAGWKEIGLEHFPTEGEAIEIAKKASPYFVRLFKDTDELANFKATYDFHKDVWEEIKK